MPNALRRKESTTTIRVKEVTITRIEGASDRIVTSAMICRIVCVWLAPAAPKSKVRGLGQGRLGQQRGEAGRQQQGEQAPRRDVRWPHGCTSSA